MIWDNDSAMTVILENLPKYTGTRGTEHRLFAKELGPRTMKKWHGLNKL